MASRPPCPQRRPQLPRHAALAALIVLTFTLGCATSRDVPPAYLFYGKPPTAEMRAALGRTVVVVATNGVVVQADRPKNFGEATRHGFWWGLTDPVQQVRDNPHSDPGPGFIFAFPVWIVGQATVGTMDGAVMGVPAATSAVQQGVLRKVVNDLCPSALVARCRLDIMKRLSDPALDVQFLAARIPCSPNYLSHRFRQETGTNPIAFIHQQRVAQACRLMEAGTFATKELAHAVGFLDPTYFIRIFRRLTNQTPGQYQARLAATGTAQPLLGRPGPSHGSRPAVAARTGIHPGAV